MSFPSLFSFSSRAFLSHVTIHPVFRLIQVLSFHTSLVRGSKSYNLDIWALGERVPFHIFLIYFVALVRHSLAFSFIYHFVLLNLYPCRIRLYGV